MHHHSAMLPLFVGMRVAQILNRASTPAELEASSSRLWVGTFTVRTKLRKSIGHTCSELIILIHLQATRSVTSCLGGVVVRDLQDDQDSNGSVVISVCARCQILRIAIAPFGK